MTTLGRQVEELQLLRCSLLPDETLVIISEDPPQNEWLDLLDSYCDSGEFVLEGAPTSPCRFRMQVEGIPIWFEIELPLEYPDTGNPIFSVNGIDLERKAQEAWMSRIQSHFGEFQRQDYPVYQLFSSIILPILHEELVGTSATSSTSIADESELSPKNAAEPLYHSLLTSHHLISPTKRKNMQKWSSELASIRGFAKIGYPGVIYIEGTKGDVEQFVAQVKAMQWLALHVRFMEQLKAGGTYDRPWSEFEKVGEVVQEMKRLGREEYLVEMGIGSLGK